MVKVCVPGYSIFGQRRVFACCPLEKHPHSSLWGWSHLSLWGYPSMSLEYPKLNTWTEANLGKFLIPLLYEGLFLLYEGLFSFPSLWRSTCGISLSFSCGPNLSMVSYHATHLLGTIHLLDRFHLDQNIWAPSIFFSNCIKSRSFISNSETWLPLAPNR